MGYGDELMVSGRARILQQTDPRKCRPTFQGKTKVTKGASVWENNPRIAGPLEHGDFQELVARDMNGLRPYHTAKTPERWSYNLDFRPDVGELYLTAAEKACAEFHAGRILIEPTIGPGASPNKQWGKWNELVRLLRAAGIRPAQMGNGELAGYRPLSGVDLIVTRNFRQACAVLARARAFVLPEGGLHHAAAALNIPGVVIFGGFTPVELTGYQMHTNIGASLGEACGMRTPCQHCAAAMAAISPKMVFNELQTILNANQHLTQRRKDAKEKQ